MHNMQFCGLASYDVFHFDMYADWELQALFHLMLYCLENVTAACNIVVDTTNSCRLCENNFVSLIRHTCVFELP